jgi:hypothetical protein
VSDLACDPADARTPSKSQQVQGLGAANQASRGEQSVPTEIETKSATGRHATTGTFPLHPRQPAHGRSFEPGTKRPAGRAASIDRERSMLLDLDDHVTLEHYDRFARELLAGPAR